MSGAARTSTRDIARAAIRAELAQVAFELFRRQGFDKVTLDGLAKAAGVSRNTFLRCFGTKEDVVLCARSLEKQNGWRPAIAQALTERTDPSHPATPGSVGAGRGRGGLPEHRRQPLDGVRRQRRSRRPAR